MSALKVYSKFLKEIVDENVSYIDQLKQGLIIEPDDGTYTGGDGTYTGGTSGGDGTYDPTKDNEQDLRISNLENSLNNLSIKFSSLSNLIISYSKLSLWFDYDNLNGNIVNDKSGNNRNGQLINNTITENNYFKFQGEGDFILTDYKLNRSSPFNITYSLWFKDDITDFYGNDTLNRVNLMGTYPPTAVTAFFFIVVNKDGHLIVSERNTSNISVFETINYNIVDDSWHHIVISCTTNQMNIYIDGVLVKIIGRVSGQVYDNKPFYIGGAFLNNYQTAKMRDIRIYVDYTMSGHEVETLYNMG